VDKRLPPVVVHSSASGVESWPAAADSPAAAVGNWLTVVANSQLMTAAAGSCPTAVDKPAATVAADMRAAAGSSASLATAAGSSASLATAAGNSPAAPGIRLAAAAGSWRAVVDTRPAPDNLPAVGSQAAPAAPLPTWRSQAARVPRVLRRFLCPYRRPRTQWDRLKRRPRGRGCCRPKTGQPPAVTT